MLSYIPTVRWLKFSNMAPMMALIQLFSEHRRLSDYSNHMTIIYLRQIAIGIYETLKSSFRFRVVVAIYMYFESSLFGS